MINKKDLQHVHQALHITVPLEQLSPLVADVLTKVAHQWKNKSCVVDVNAQRLNNNYTKRID